MLSSTLNFLSDKRRRLHSSHKIPTFVNDLNNFNKTRDGKILVNINNTDLNKAENTLVAAPENNYDAKRNHNNTNSRLQPYEQNNLENENNCKNELSITNSCVHNSSNNNNLIHGNKTDNGYSYRFQHQRQQFELPPNTFKISSNSVEFDFDLFNDYSGTAQRYFLNNHITSSTANGWDHIQFVHSNYDVDKLFQFDTDIEQYSNDKKTKSHLSNNSSVSRTHTKTSKVKLKHFESTEHAFNKYQNKLITNEWLRSQSISTYCQTNSYNTHYELNNTLLRDHMSDKSSVDHEMKNIDQCPNSHLITSPCYKISNYSNRHINIFENFEEISLKATKYEYFIINALHCIKPANETSQSKLISLKNLDDSHDIRSKLDFISTGLLSNKKFDKHNAGHKPHRNNSSITYSFIQKYNDITNGYYILKTNSTADDLSILTEYFRVLKKHYNYGVMKLINKLFVVIQQNDLENFLLTYYQLEKLSKDNLFHLKTALNEYDLSILDCSLLISSPFLISCLLICDFLPGPVIQKIFITNPHFDSHYQEDYLQSHLTYLLLETEQHINEIQLTQNLAILRTKELANNTNHTYNDINNTKEIFDVTFPNIGSKEKKLNNLLSKFEFLNKLNKSLSKYPLHTPPPKKVRIFLYTPTSLLIRISPPKIIYESSRNHVCDDKNSSCESSDNDTDLENIKQDGRMTYSNDLYDNFVIKYCIEWSLCPKFTNEPVYSCLVQPPIRFNKHASKQTIFKNSTLLRVGFYLLTNLPNKKLIFIRVSSISIHGWSKACYSCPKSILLSSWSDNSIIQLVHLKINLNYKFDFTLTNSRFIGLFANHELDCLKQNLSNVLLSWISNSSLAQSSTNLNLGTNIDDSNNNINIIKNNYTKSNAPTHSNGKNNKYSRLPLFQTKRSLRFPFSCKNLKFVKQTKSGVYLAFVYYASSPSSSALSTFDSKMNKNIDTILFSSSLITPGLSSSSTATTYTNSPKKKCKTKIILADGNIPIINITRDTCITESNLITDFNWFSRLITDSYLDLNLKILLKSLFMGDDPTVNNNYCYLSYQSLPTNLQFRINILNILQKLQKLLIGSSNLGVVYPEIIRTKFVNISINSNSKKSENTTFTKQSNTSTYNANNTDNDTKVFNKFSTDSNQLNALNIQNNKSALPAFLFVLIKKINNPKEILLTSNLKWCSLDKFLKHNKVKTQQSDSFANNLNVKNYVNFSSNQNSKLFDSNFILNRNDQCILPESQVIINLNLLIFYYENHSLQLDPGLYIAFVQMKVDIDQKLSVLVAQNQSVMHMLPVEKIRARSHVSKNEWYTLCHLIEQEHNRDIIYSFDEHDNFLTITEYEFLAELMKALNRLTRRLNIDPEHFDQYSIYLQEIIQISPMHSLIILLPSTEHICLPPTCNIMLPKHFSWLSLNYFERNLNLNYDYTFHKQCQHLLAILELLIPLSKFMQRQCLCENNLNKLTEHTQNLQMIQVNLDSILQKQRWLGDIVTIGRGRKRQTDLIITLQKLLNAYNSFTCELFSVNKNFKLGQNQDLFIKFFDLYNHKMNSKLHE